MATLTNAHWLRPPDPQQWGSYTTTPAPTVAVAYSTDPAQHFEQSPGPSDARYHFPPQPPPALDSLRPSTATLPQGSQEYERHQHSIPYEADQGRPSPWPSPENHPQHRPCPPGSRQPAPLSEGSYMPAGSSGHAAPTAFASIPHQSESPLPFTEEELWHLWRVQQEFDGGQLRIPEEEQRRRFQEFKLFFWSLWRKQQEKGQGQVAVEGRATVPARPNLDQTVLAPPPPPPPPPPPATPKRKRDAVQDQYHEQNIQTPAKKLQIRMARTKRFPQRVEPQNPKPSKGPSLRTPKATRKKTPRRVLPTPRPPSPILNYNPLPQPAAKDTIQVVIPQRNQPKAPASVLASPPRSLQHAYLPPGAELDQLEFVLALQQARKQNPYNSALPRDFSDAPCEMEPSFDSELEVSLQERAGVRWLFLGEREGWRVTLRP
ncbi:hypothetical protein FN846DRAFT_907955 [Sphaerosporella brunnea]|uniref:Uncharacterized protein n=1 Tax=Sphaerosporella brunnea TaxID=1250544 RepID=A0A5J5EU30_9PEZI|nr:hypothetical protein FN846DRAFT_907955 [Sphaerosporella brunnea]